MVVLYAAAGPLAGGGARRGQAPFADCHRLPRDRRVWRRFSPVGDSHNPAFVGRVARDGDVAAEADQDAGAGAGAGRGPGGAVGAERLCGGAQVEAHADRDADPATAAIEVDVLPRRHVPCSDHDRPRRIELLEAPVVSEVNQALSDGRIDKAVGARRGRERDDGEYLTQPLRYFLSRCRPPGIIELGQLAIVPEPAAGQVTRLDLCGGRRLYRIRLSPTGGADDRHGAQGPEAREHGGGGHDAPELTEADREEEVGRVVDVVDVAVVDVELWMVDIAAAVLEVAVVALVLGGVALLAAAVAVVWLARSAMVAVPATPTPASTAVTARARRRRLRRTRRTRPVSASVGPLGDVEVEETVTATIVGMATESGLSPVWEGAENPRSPGSSELSTSPERGRPG